MRNANTILFGARAVLQILGLVLWTAYCKPGTPSPDPLSREWAVYLRQNPNAAMDAGKAKARAQELRLEGLALYRVKKDAEALGKYEESLRLVADSDTYYDYGNSLSNVQGRLEDSIRAYQIGIELSGSPPANLYYNLACAQSRADHTSEAIENLMIAYRLGKDLGTMEADADLVNVRRITDWREKVMTAGLPVVESPAGKSTVMPVGGGAIVTFFCGAPNARTGRVVRSWESYGQSSRTKTGTWSFKSSTVTVHFTHEVGETGMGPSKPGPRGPVYSQFQKYEKQIDERESFGWDGNIAMTREFSGPCPE